MIRSLTHAAAMFAVVILPGPFPGPAEHGNHKPHCSAGSQLVILGRNLHHHKIYGCQSVGITEPPVPGGFGVPGVTDPPVPGGFPR